MNPKMFSSSFFYNYYTTATMEKSGRIKRNLKSTKKNMQKKLVFLDLIITDINTELMSFPS